MSDYKLVSLSAADLKQGPWLGIRNERGAAVLIEIVESLKHPGFYHYRVFDFSSSISEQTKKPVTANFMLGYIDYVKKEYMVDEFYWQQWDIDPPDAPLGESFS